MAYRRGLGALSISDILASAAAKYGLSLDFLTSVARRESAFNPSARSSAGAMGVMQLMPATAAQYGVSDPWDAAQNIDGGAHLLSDLLRKYNGNVTLALAAYNAGPGNVAKYGGVPPFPETQAYISRILSDIGSNSVAAGSQAQSPGVFWYSEAGESGGGLNGAAIAAIALAGVAGLYLLTD